MGLGAEDRDEEKDYICVEEHIRCPAIPHCSPRSLQAAMQLVNIQTLAFTPPHTLPWRVYLYTHAQRTLSDDTRQSTLVMGELLYTGEADQITGGETGTGDGDTADKTAAEGREQEQVKQREEAVVAGLNGRETAREDGGEDRVKVTLKQRQPKDEEALRGFLSILTTVLHTLSSERA